MRRIKSRVVLVLLVFSATAIAGCTASDAQDPIFRIDFETLEEDTLVSRYEETFTMGLTGEKTWEHRFEHPVLLDNLTRITLVFGIQRQPPPMTAFQGTFTRIDANSAWLIPDGTRWEHTGTMSGHQKVISNTGFREHLNPVPQSGQTLTASDLKAAQASAAEEFTSTDGSGTWVLQIEIEAPPQTEPWGNEITVYSEVRAQTYEAKVTPLSG